MHLKTPKIIRLVSNFRILTPFLIGILSFSSIHATILASSNENSNMVVENIEVEGLQRTRNKVVFGELLFSKGDTISENDILDSKTRILNTRLFSKVHIKTEFIAKKGGKDHVKVKINLNERWTTIPIIRFQKGGGVSHFILGAYDINFLGRYYEVGAQYERFGDQNSGVAWYKNPRLFGKRINLSFDVWSINRQLHANSNDGKSKFIKEFELIHKRNKLSLVVDKEWFWWLKSGIGFQYHGDSFTDKKMLGTPNMTFSDDIKGGDTAIFSGIFTFGRINYLGYNLEGHNLNQTFNIAISDKFFLSSEVHMQNFFLLPFGSNFGINTKLYFSNAYQFQYLSTLGGFNAVRGYSNDRFKGTHSFFTNFELRIPSYKNDWFVLQHVLFSDIGTVSRSIATLLDEFDAYNFGMGIRIVSPKIYRLVVRLDYSITLKNNEDQAISFGMQQFF